MQNRRDMLQQIPLNILDVIIRTPEGITYKGSVEALTLIDEKGPFDILPLHTNFISIIKEKITIYEKKDTKKEITIEEGIVKVFENHVDIFLGIQTTA